MKEIEFIESYYDVSDIQSYYTNINDTFSNGPYDFPKNKLGWQGCFDRPLRLEDTNNPVHGLFDKIQKDYGEFDEIIEGSVRYLNGPFLPHLDLGNNEILRRVRQKNNYGTFVIPLSWKLGYNPGTAFFSSPPQVNEDIYNDRIGELPEYSDAFAREETYFSVKDIFHWKNPGDLVFWYGLQWHSTTDTHTWNFTKSADNWAKEFITIRVFFKNPIKFNNLAD